MAKVIGLVNLHTNVSLGALTERRPAASVSFLGRYALVDFVLSNMSNSTIDKVGVLVQNKPRSIIKHLGGGTSWNLNQKRGGLSVLYNEPAANTAYNTDLNNLAENIAFLKEAKGDYAVIAPAHIINTINYEAVVEAHVASGADITVVYSSVENADTAWLGADCLALDHGVVKAVEANKGGQAARNVSLETYVVSTATLKAMVKEAKTISALYTLKDYVEAATQTKKVVGYEYQGYVACIDSLESYYKCSLELLDYVNNTMVFKSNWPIFTNSNDTPPTKYLKNSSVKKAFVANGALIDGTVKNSVIGREVVIGTGATVENSIILSGAKIAPGAVIKNAIIDKYAEVVNKLELEGTPEKPLYVKEGDTI